MCKDFYFNLPFVSSTEHMKSNSLSVWMKGANKLVRVILCVITLLWWLFQSFWSCETGDLIFRMEKPSLTRYKKCYSWYLVWVLCKYQWSLSINTLKNPGNFVLKNKKILAPRKRKKISALSCNHVWFILTLFLAFDIVLTVTHGEEAVSLLTKEQNDGCYYFSSKI